MDYPHTIYFWRVRDEVTGRMRQTRYRMTEADARKTYPDAVKVEAGALEITGPSLMYGDKPCG